MGITYGSLASTSLRPIFAASINPVLSLVLVVAAFVLVVALVLILNKRSGVSQSVQAFPPAAPTIVVPPTVVSRVLQVTTAGGTHIGGRSNNEDAYLLKGNLVVIADGMGGQASGEVASNAVIEAFNEIDTASVTWLSDGILGGNAKMLALVTADRSLKNFGTTVVAARHADDEMELGSSGDSHFFRLRGGKLERLTEEHSIAVALFKSGQISESEVATNKFKNTLYRYIGGKHTDPEWDTLKFQMQSGDIYLVCSDGLVDYSDLVRVQQILESGKSAQEIVDDLLANAVADQTKDNATAIVMLVA